MHLIVRILLSLTLLFANCKLNAQQNKCDSLLEVSKSVKGEEKFNVLIELSNVSPEFDDKVRFANNAIKIAETLDQKYLVDAYQNLAQIYSDAYEDVDALESFKQALPLALKANYGDGILNAYDGIMRSYFYLDSLEDSKKYADTLQNQADKYQNLKFKSYAYLQKARILQVEGDIDSSLKLTKLTLELREQIGDRLDVAQTYKFLGQIYYNNAQFEQAIECYNKEIEIKEEINYEQKYLAIAYQNLGNTQFAIGNYQLALEKTQKALTLFETSKYDVGIAVCCSGIGDIYQNLSQSDWATDQNENNFNKALEYYSRALQLFIQLEDVENQGIVLQSIGTVYSRLTTNSFVAKYGEEWEDSIHTLKRELIREKFSTSLEYYNRALNIYTQREQSKKVIRAIVNVNTNIGSIYNWGRDWQNAYQHIQNALKLARDNDFSLEITSALYALGENNLGRDQLQQAEITFTQCAALSKELGLKETLRYCYNKLSILYERTGQPQKSLDYFRMAVKIKDEIFTAKNQRSINEMQTIYETDKKERENRLLRNEKDLQDSIIQRQRFTIIGAIVCALLILMVALLMFRMFRNKQQANRVLKEKNNLITIQKKQITDSIKYASFIQQAVMPTKSLIDSLLPNNFVLYMPKDIVSGDFYWITRVGGKVVITAADCTGHGVPGAFMSMLGISFLYEVVNKDLVLKPSEILNNLRNLIITTLGQKGKVNEQKDGMDISLCVIDFQNMVLEWAGAYNPLFQIRNGELLKYSADKMPVAIHVKDNVPFTNHTIEMRKGDTFYIFSDGYSDQFGGEDGRKYMGGRFKNFLVDNSSLSIDEQCELLRQEHINWRGRYEQTDDVLVIGFRV